MMRNNKFVCECLLKVSFYINIVGDEMRQRGGACISTNELLSTMEQVDGQAIAVGAPVNAPAAGYSEPDVEWHTLDEETLQKLENGAENMKGLRIQTSVIYHEVIVDDGIDFILHPWADAERIGNAIANSKNLLKLDIREFGDELLEAPWLLNVFRGLARNRSIEHLEMYEVHQTVLSSFEVIFPFFEHNHNLRCIDLHTIDLTAHFDSFLLGLSLCDKNQLERILLYENNLRGRQVTRVINALRDHRNLLHLQISGSNCISRYGFLALSKLLQNPRSKIHCLEVGDIFVQNSFDDECITILTGALVVSKTIKTLSVSSGDVTAYGWRFLSSVLRSPISSLERLTIWGCLLNDEGIIVIGLSLIKNKVLNYLKISGSSDITPAGWQGFSTCLRSPACALQELDFRHCDTVNGIAGALAVNTSVQKLNISASSLPDAGAIEIADALAVNSSLKVLRMNGNRSVTASGWVAFFNRLRYSACSLEKLDVSSNNIDDEGAAALVDLVAGMITLNRLKLTNCNSITNNGWRVIARIPQTSSNVTYLKLGGNNFKDDAVIHFAAVLATNKHLSNLTLDGREITDRIWGAFSNILCDNSSVQSTYLSNHTLHSLETTRYHNGDNWTQVQVPDNIAHVLELNEENQDKVVLARQKIISNHFSASRINTQAFAVMSVPVLPHAIEWIGRDLLGFSLLYQVSRSVLVPKLFE